MRQNPWLKGVRHVVQDEPDDRFILGEAFNEGIRKLEQFDLVYDILIYERQLSASIEFVDLHPNLSLVLDHVAKPRIADGLMDPWKDQMFEMARRGRQLQAFRHGDRGKLDGVDFRYAVALHGGCLGGLWAGSSYVRFRLARRSLGS